MRARLLKLLMCCIKIVISGAKKCAYIQFFLSSFPIFLNHHHRTPVQYTYKCVLLLLLLFFIRARSFVIIHIYSISNISNLIVSVLLLFVAGFLSLSLSSWASRQHHGNSTFIFFVVHFIFRLAAYTTLDSFFFHMLISIPIFDVCFKCYPSIIA